MKIVSWFFGFFFILMSFMFFDKGLGFISVFSILGALIVTPFSRDKINTLLKNKNYSFQITGKSAAISGSILFFVCAVLMPEQTPKQEKTAILPKIEINSSVPIQKEESTPRVYIDEVYKLQQLTEQLINYTYVAPYPSFKQFAQVKKNLERNIEPTCNYLKELVNTTGHYKSEYQDESLGCADTIFSMMVVLFDIRDGDYNSIKEQREKLIMINANLVKQLDKYKNTPEFKTKVNKYLSKESSKWYFYPKGTLEGKGALDWQKAPEKQKIATSAMIVINLLKDKKIKSSIADKIKKIDDLKPLAEELTKSLNVAFEKEKSAEANNMMYVNQKINETSVILMTLMGWL